MGVSLLLIWKAIPERVLFTSMKTIMEVNTVDDGRTGRTDRGRRTGRTDRRRRTGRTYIGRRREGGWTDERADDDFFSFN